MSRRRVMIIGATGAGKTALANELNGVEGAVKKTQDIQYGQYTIDVPGAYLENPHCYRHIISAAQNGAAQVLFVVDQSRPEGLGAPGFMKVFGCPVAGVITKCDIEQQNKALCQKELRRIGAPEPFFSVSSKTGEGMEGLREWLWAEGKR